MEIKDSSKTNPPGENDQIVILNGDIQHTPASLFNRILSIIKRI